MRLDTSRRIIATILEIVIAVSTVIFLISVIMTFTTADKNFFINQFATPALEAECNAQLNMKYEALSNETSIPARVFERVTEDYPTDEALRQAALSVFSEENETLYSENKINYFYELSVEYLDGNEISYNKDDIKRAAEQAAKIYSDTVGLHNTGGIQARIARFSRIYPQTTIASFIVAFVCFPAVMVMYKRKKHGYFNAIGGILAGSAATALSTFVLAITRFGSSIDILPEIHREAMVSTSSKNFLIITFFSVIVVAGSLSAMRVIDRKIRDED